VGSKIPGTMSAISKLGFAKKKDAEEFVKQYGGEIKDFDDTFKLSRESLNPPKKPKEKKPNNSTIPNQ